MGWFLSVTKLKFYSFFFQIDQNIATENLKSIVQVILEIYLIIPNSGVSMTIMLPEDIFC